MILTTTTKQVYAFPASPHCGAWIRVLMKAAQPQPLRFFCAQRTASPVYGGLGGAAARLAGAFPVRELRSVRHPMIRVVRWRVYNPNRKAIMNTQIALNISNIPVRQDAEGRFNLNDLHKASGGEQKHQPANWIRLQQTTDLVDFLTSEESIAGIPAILTKQGLGTFVVKELVYAYAMWISAKFHIAVIRAYDALVTGQLLSNPEQLPEPKTKKALPGGLTLEQQDTIKALVKARAEELPKDKQAGAIIKQWSAIKQKFGCTYKEVSPDNFVNILSLLSRLPIEGELLGKETDPFTDSTYRREAQKAFNVHFDACHADMESAGVTPPSWPVVDDKIIDGLAASLLFRGRWIASFDSSQKLQMNRMTDDDCVIGSSNPDQIKSFVHHLDFNMLRVITDEAFSSLNRLIDRATKH